MRKVKVKKDWWKKTFNDMYFISYDEDFSNKDTKEQVNFVIQHANIKKTDKILDLGCGIGRHAIALAKLGYNVSGLDFSKDLIKIARDNAKKAGVKVNFFTGDMRNIKIIKKFDVVICLFTTFGYFSKNENIKVLKQISKIIPNDGRVIIDMYDYKKVFEKFKKARGFLDFRNVVNINSEYKRGNIPTKDEQYFDLKSGVEYTKRTFKYKGKEYIYDLYLTFYNDKQYKDMLREANLEIIDRWGEFDGSAISNNTTRTIMLIKHAHK